jgi:hypothetical protein
MKQPIAPYRHLESNRIIETVEKLQSRIGDRFPGSGLSKLVAELLVVAQETVTRTQWISKAHLPLRCTTWLLIVGIIALVVRLLFNIHQFRLDDFTNFIQSLEASISAVVFIGAAIVFLISAENRVKRQRALKALHELRAMAHIVDMHQLTKDPESHFMRGPRTASSPERVMTAFELNRYLDYCSEALALIAKIAALYAQEFQDPVLLNAVDDVEDLAAGFSRKIWQKITILETLGSAGTLDTQHPSNRPAGQL